VKPNWDEAPSWANWWAIDEGDDEGFAEWGWFENTPHFVVSWWCLGNTGGKSEYDYTTDYKNGPPYKEKRPTT
jgi:hypothetical protein